MRVIRLKLRYDWYTLIQAAAEQNGQQVEEFILDLVERLYPPPRKKKAADNADLVVLYTREFCRRLEAIKADFVKALEELQPPIKRATKITPAEREKRRKTAENLRAAARSRNMTQQQLASAIGVTRSVVSKVMANHYPLPKAWRPSLNQVLGEDWMTG